MKLQVWLYYNILFVFENYFILCGNLIDLFEFKNKFNSLFLIHKLNPVILQYIIIKLDNIIFNIIKKA